MVLLPCRSKLIVVRNFTSDAAKVIFEPIDFVYVDARHDYCGAWEDMELYWPKVRCLVLPATASTAVQPATAMRMRMCTLLVCEP